MKQQLKQAGFTLIELLVTISIVLLMAGAGIAGFVGFNDRQQVQTAVKDIQSVMRSAQVKARAGEGASLCVSPERLKGYQVATTTTAVILSRVCENPNTNQVTSVTERSRVTLDSVTVTHTPNVPITFLSLRGGVDLSGQSAVTITVAGHYSSILQEFQVLNTGEITAGQAP